MPVTSGPTVVILNPSAGGSRAERLWPMLRRTLDTTLGTYALRRTQGPGDAIRHTRTALRRGADRIVAIGGDGTLNEVVNGFFAADTPVQPEAVLAPISCGTGSDFRRSLGASRSPDAAVRTLLQRRIRTVDVGRLQHATASGRDAVRYFLNVASLGLGGAVDQVVHTLPAKAQMGGRLAYLYAILYTLARYHNQPITLDVDDATVYVGPICNVAVANGRFFGGGLQIAPDAQVDDGQLDVIVLGDLPRRALLRHARRFYQGSHLHLDGVLAFRGRRVTARPRTDEPVRLDVDGEAMGRLPATFTVLPHALRIQY